MPVPHNRPSAYSHIDVLPVQELSYSGDAKVAVMKSRERSSFLNITTEPFLTLQETLVLQ